MMRPRKVIVFAALVAGSAVLGPGGAVPGAATGARAGEGPGDGTPGSWSIGFAGTGRSGVGESESAYELRTGMIDLERGSLAASGKVLQFDWSGGRDLFGDTRGRVPWGRLYHLDLGFRRGGVLTPRLMYAALLGVTTGFEEELDRSVSGYGGAYGLYRIGPMWMVSVGAFYSRHQEVATDYDFVPILGISWNAQAAGGLSVNLGLPSTDAVWRFSDATRLTLSLEYSSAECGVYRLADDNPLRPGGYVELAGSTVTLRFDTRVHGDVAIGLGVTHALDQEFKLHDPNGYNEETYDVEKQPGLVLSVSRAF